MSPANLPPEYAMTLATPHILQVHIHVADRPPVQPPPEPGAAPARSRPLLTGLCVVLIAGAGYAVGSRQAAPSARADLAALVAPPPPLVPSLAPTQPDLPPALRQPFTQPPVLTPPPGAARPGHNPFGLGG